MKSLWARFIFAYSLIGLVLCLRNLDASAASATWETCKGANPEQSVPACTDLLARQPAEGDVPRAEILKQRARSYMKSFSKRDKAIPDLTEVIALTPGDWEAFAMRTEANEAVGNHLAALKDYDAALAIDPNYKKPDGYVLSIRRSRNYVAAIVDHASLTTPPDPIETSHTPHVRPNCASARHPDRRTEPQLLGTQRVTRRDIRVRVTNQP